jgi:UDPglucose 6-dehydrogenase
MRDAPSIDIAMALEREGVKVRAYDPVAMENAHRILPTVEMQSDAYAVAQDADALILVTEWNEFKNLDLERLRTLMKQPVMIDGRNIYDPEVPRSLGFQYRAMGRGYNGEGVFEIIPN